LFIGWMPTPSRSGETENDIVTKEYLALDFAASSGN